MIIAFASGKGGTGKTLLSTAFARLLASEGQPVDYLDADVEEPNGHLLLRPHISGTRRFAVNLPALAGSRCTGCGVCQRVCAFNAILALKDRVLVFPELCHACGGCLLACPEDALVEKPVEVGTVREGQVGPLRFVDGLLDIGQARSTPLVEAVVAAGRAPTVVVDCPPGTSCPVMAAIRHADLVVLVTEPTPFGLHDLQLAVSLCRELSLPFLVVLNRSDLGDDATERWLVQEGSPAVAQIPFDRAIAEAYARGEPAERCSPAFLHALESLRQALSGVVPPAPEERLMEVAP